MSTTAIDAGARRTRRRATAVVAAGLAPALIWAVSAAGGAQLTAGLQDGEPPVDVGLPAVLTVGLLAALAGWAALALLERLTARAWTVWAVLAVAVLAVSFVPVFAAEASTGTTAALAAMHLAVAAVLIPGLRPARTLR